MSSVAVEEWLLVVVAVTIIGGSISLVSVYLPSKIVYPSVYVLKKGDNASILFVGDSEWFVRDLHFILEGKNGSVSIYYKNGHFIGSDGKIYGRHNGKTIAGGDVITLNIKGYNTIKIFYKDKQVYNGIIGG